MVLVPAIDNVHIYRDVARSRTSYGDVLWNAFAGDDHRSESDLGACAARKQMRKGYGISDDVTDPHGYGIYLLSKPRS
jgi:hypothetical protein